MVIPKLIKLPVNIVASYFCTCFIVEIALVFQVIPKKSRQSYAAKNGESSLICYIFLRKQTLEYAHVNYCRLPAHFPFSYCKKVSGYFKIALFTVIASLKSFIPKYTQQDHCRFYSFQGRVQMGLGKCSNFIFSRY